jgi:hypothetical protein
LAAVLLPLLNGVNQIFPSFQEIETLPLIMATVGDWYYEDIDADKIEELVAPVWTWSETGTRSHIQFQIGSCPSPSPSPEELESSEGPKYAEFRSNDSADARIAKCVMCVNYCDLPHSNVSNDMVVVGEHSYSRTRYRACCNPAFFVYKGVTYVIVNTDLSTLTVYNTDTGQAVTKIGAPEMMTAILGYKNNPLKFHLFGWMWGPHELECSVDMERIMSSLAPKES